MSADCLFCQIASHQIPARIVEETDDMVVFSDINPQAPTHVLVVPKAHIPKVSDLTEATAPVLSKAILAANRLAERLGVASGYRLVVNCGAGAGQSVFHLHVHLLGGRPMRWPPG